MVATLFTILQVVTDTGLPIIMGVGTGGGAVGGAVGVAVMKTKQKQTEQEVRELKAWKAKHEEDHKGLEIKIFSTLSSMETSIQNIEKNVVK